MANAFAGRTVLVTGATSGIGFATASAFVREGASVVLSGRRTERGDACAAELRTRGDAIFIAADVTRPDDVRALVAGCVRHYGRLDCAVNNAGTGGVAVRTGDYPETAWHDVINTNLTGVFLCMKYEIPELLKQPSPAIVNVASVAGLVAGPVGCAYTASKHGVIGLTKAAAMEYAAKGLRVNAVAPGVVRTAMTEDGFFGSPAVAGQIAALHPLGRVGTPDEIANAIVWLSSDAASFVTGETLAIDGGFLAR